MRNKRALCWWIALGMTGFMFALIGLFFEVRFTVNDDSAMLRAFLGGEGMPTFHLYLHGLLVWPLRWLSAAMPGVAWYSWMQMALLFLAALVCAKSLMQCFVNQGKGLGLGAAFAALFLGGFCFNLSVSITFTVTAALLGAAAVLQMMSIDFARASARQMVLGALGAALLAALAYALRQVTILPIAAVCGLGFAWLWITCKRTGPMLAALLAAALVLGGAMGTRQWEMRRSGCEEYLRFQDANTYVLDYYDPINLTEEDLALVGWDSHTVNMMTNFCLLDSDLTAEKFETLTAHLQQKDPRTAADRLAMGWGAFETTAEQYPFEMALLALAGLVGLVEIGLALIRRKRGLALMAGLTLLLVAGMMAYLMLEGRLPLHAVYAPALPAAALLFALLPACLPGLRSSVCLATALAIACGCCAAPLLSPMLKNEEAALENPHVMADLEEYAAFNPECLFLFDMTMVLVDTRAFPDYSDGAPDNLCFWGGWEMGSPQSIALFERFGIDIRHFEPEMLLREDIYIASGRIDPPPMFLQRWLTDELGVEVEASLSSEYGSVYLFQFYEY